jgi:hypothetical protein
VRALPASIGIMSKAVVEEVRRRFDNDEDSPRPLMFQLELPRAVGFSQVDILHKNGCFVAFGGGEGECGFGPAEVTRGIAVGCNFWQSETCLLGAVQGRITLRRRAGCPAS